MEKIEDFAVDLEQLTNLIQLSAFMQGRINIGELPSNEKIAAAYPCQLETLLDHIADRAAAMDQDLDGIIKSMMTG